MISHYPQNNKQLIKLVFILGLITMVGPLCIDMYLPAFVAISYDFDVPENLVQLTITSYLIGLAIGQPLYGPLIDRFGKKPLLLIGIAIFVLASIGCVFANNIYQLIIFRFFQSLGSCAVSVVPRAIVRDIFGTKETTKILSYLILVMGVAPIIAPVFGSIFLDFFYSWRAIFIFLSIFGFCLIAICLKFVPQTQKANPRQKIKYTCKKYKNILQDFGFLIPAITSAMVFSCIFSYISGAPIIYLNYYQISHQNFSLIFAFNSIGFVIASQINAKLLKKFEAKIIVKNLLKILIFNSIILVTFVIFFDNIFIFTALLFVNLSLCGALLPNSAGLALSSQKRYSGSASAMLGTLQFTVASMMSFIVSRFGGSSTVPMPVIIGFCVIVAFVVFVPNKLKI